MLETDSMEGTLLVRGPGLLEGGEKLSRVEDSRTEESMAGNWEAPALMTAVLPVRGVRVWE